MKFNTEKEVEILNNVIDKCESDVVMMSPDGEMSLLNKDSHPDAESLMGEWGEWYEFYPCRNDEYLFTDMFKQNPQILNLRLPKIHKSARAC